MDQLDSILLSEEELAPRPGFAARVMTAVRSENHPQPLRFPWALVGTALVAALGLSMLVAITAEAMGGLSWLADLVRQGTGGVQRESMLWAVGVLIGSGLAAIGALELLDD